MPYSTVKGLTVGELGARASRPQSRRLREGLAGACLRAAGRGLDARVTPILAFPHKGLAGVGLRFLGANDLQPVRRRGHGSGSSRTPRHILPFASRRLSAAKPRRNTLTMRLRSGAAFGGDRSALGLFFSA